MELNLTREITIDWQGTIYASSITIQYLEQRTARKWLCAWSIPYLCDRGAAFGRDPIDALIACIKIVGLLLRGSEKDGIKVTWKHSDDYAGFPDVSGGVGEIQRAKQALKRLQAANAPLDVVSSTLHLK